MHFQSSVYWSNRTGSPAFSLARFSSPSRCAAAVRVLPHALDSTAIGAGVSDVGMGRIDDEAPPVICSIDGSYITLDD